MSRNPHRDRDTVRSLAQAIAEEAAGLATLRIMHVCGTHEHEISRYGLRSLLPANVRLIAGPGCPVCITPASVIATAIELALLPDHPVVCSYGDMVRVPTARGSLLDSRGEGADIRVVYGVREAVTIAHENPERRVVFFSVGFETTTAPVAAAVHAGLPDNMLLYTCQRYVPPAVDVLCSIEKDDIDGFLLPGHATVITGIGPYGFLPEKYGIPAAVAGFEPVDVLTAMLSIVRQARRHEPAVANCYRRAVRDEGNIRAQELLAEVFDSSDAMWRGIGVLPGTGLALREKYTGLDALVYYDMEEVAMEEIKTGCKCDQVLLGRITSEECPLFRTVCTPEDPQGPCMVSTEGTCRAHFLYPEAV